MEPIVRSNEEIWREKLDEAILYFEMNNRRPSLFSEHDREQESADLILQQLNSRENGMEIMAREDIRDVWEAFKNEYIEHFRSNE